MIEKPDNISPFPYRPRSRVGGLWWSVVRFGFRLLYNEMAWTYDFVSWVVSFGQWRAWQRTALEYLNVAPGSYVLEIAHGTGSLQLDMAAAGLSRGAIDYSRAMGRIARRKLKRHHVTANLARSKAQTLPFPDAAFDGVVSTFPTPFIIEPDTLNEVYRVLKPGGRFVIIPNAVLTKGGLAKEAMEAAYRVTGQRGPWRVELEQRFVDTGFVVSVTFKELQRSIVQVVIAEKPDKL